MRIPRAVPATLLVTALAAPAGVGALAAPAAAQTPPDACAQRLDTAERTTYRFEQGRRSLSWARLVVTPTRADEDLYCIQVRFGGRSALHRTSTTGYERRGGRWVKIGQDGGGAHRRASYTETVRPPARRRTDRVYEVRANGRWYRAEASIRNP